MTHRLPGGDDLTVLDHEHGEVTVCAAMLSSRVVRVLVDDDEENPWAVESDDPCPQSLLHRHYRIVLCTPAVGLLVTTIVPGKVAAPLKKEPTKV